MTETTNYEERQYSVLKQMLAVSVMGALVSLGLLGLLITETISVVGQPPIVLLGGMAVMMGAIVGYIRYINKKVNEYRRLYAESPETETDEHTEVGNRFERIFIISVVAWAIIGAIVMYLGVI